MMPEPAEQIAEMDPYEVSESATLSNDEKADYLKLDWNELTEPPSAAVKQQLARTIEDGHFEFYPDVSATTLREAIGDYLSVDPDSVLVFNGSDGAIRTILDTYISDGRTVAASQPVYTQPYTFVRTNSGTLETFTTSDPFEPTLDELETKLDRIEPAVFYFPNPNNPTGTQYTSEQIESLLARFPQTLFIIDEAYMEFTDGTVVQLTESYENLAVTRTFSKAFGLAGLRIGYVVAHSSVRNQLQKVRNGKSVNILGQRAAVAALEDTDSLSERVKNVADVQSWIVDELRDAGFTIQPTNANFFLIRVPDAALVVEELKRRDILVRDRSDLPQLDGFIRVSVGTRSQMERFLDTFLDLDDELIRR